MIPTVEFEFILAWKARPARRNNDNPKKKIEAGNKSVGKAAYDSVDCGRAFQPTRCFDRLRIRLKFMSLLIALYTKYFGR